MRICQPRGLALHLALVLTACKSKPNDGREALDAFQAFVANNFSSNPAMQCRFRVDVRETHAVNEPWEGLLHADINMVDKDGKLNEFGWTVDTVFDRAGSSWTCSKTKSKSADPTMDACETIERFCRRPQQREGSSTPAPGTTSPATSTTMAHCTAKDLGTGANECTFVIHGTAFDINEAGHGTQTVDGKRVAFKLPLVDGSVFSGARVAEYNNDAIIVFEAGTVEGAWSGVVRFAAGASAPAWSANLGGFNVSDGVVENGRLYIGAIDLAACLDLDTGRFVWRHDDLKFNAIERPVLDGEDVELREIPQTNMKPRVFRLRKSDGLVRH